MKASARRGVSSSAPDGVSATRCVGQVAQCMPSALATINAALASAARGRGADESRAAKATQPRPATKSV